MYEAKFDSELKHGQRMKLTGKGIRYLYPKEKEVRGTFLRYTKYPDRLYRILRDGKKFPDTFHWAYWEKDTGVSSGF